MRRGIEADNPHTPAPTPLTVTGAGVSLRLINPAQARDFVENVDTLAIVAVDLPTLDVLPDPQSS